MAAKISKEDLTLILRGIHSKGDYDTMVEAVEAFAEEFGIDLTEKEDDEDEVVIEEVDDIFYKTYEDEDEDADY